MSRHNTLAKGQQETAEDLATREWAAKRFGLDINDVVWYHSGICYDRIVVRTKVAADKVKERVKGRTVNGGMLDGMPLGGATRYDAKGSPHYGCYDVTC